MAAGFFSFFFFVDRIPPAAHRGVSTVDRPLEAKQTLPLLDV
jgi:hypothetical protein